jgi:hypothetical protein
MAELRLSSYITRSGRKVILKSSESREIKNSSGGSDSVQVFKGDLYRADGQTVDSEHEWTDTLRNGVFGEHVNHNSNFQVASEYDLVQHIG